MSLEAIFSEVFSLPIARVNDQLQLSDIPTWDSMSHMSLVIRLEDVFSVQLTGDEIADLKSVGDARRALRAHGAAA